MRFFTKVRALINFPGLYTAAKYVLIVYVFLSATVWSVAIPLSRAPDEPSHFIMSKYIGEYGRLPRFGDIYNSYCTKKDPIATACQFTLMRERKCYAYPYELWLSLPYVIGGIVYHIFASIGFSDPTIWVLLRFQSIIASTLNIIVLFKVAELLFSKIKSTGFYMVGLIALLPQYTFLSSYYNPDIVSMLFSSLVLYTGLKYVAKSTWRNALYLGLSAGLVLLSRYNYFVVLLFIGIVLIEKIARSKNKLPVIKQLLGAAAVSILISGWYYVRNFVLYHDLLGTNYLQKIQVATCGPTAHFGFCYTSGVCTIPQLLQTKWLFELISSFFAAFDWMMYFYDQQTYTYVYYTMLSVFAVIVISVLYRAAKRLNSTHTIIRLTALSMILIAFWLVSFSTRSYEYQPQGRFIFNILPFLAFLIVDTCTQLKPMSAKAVLSLAGLILLFYNLHSLLLIILHYYD